MRLRLSIIGLLLAVTVAIGQPSYWFQQFQRQGNAQLAQEYFIRGGQGVFMTFTNPYAYVNTYGTNLVISIATNAIYAQYATNWLGSNALYVLLSSQITNYTAGTNITFTPTGPNTYSISSSGGGTNVPTAGLTTNICVVFCDATTNTLYFTNGLLAGISPSVVHCSSLILPGGGYLIQPSGGTLCLP